MVSALVMTNTDVPSAPQRSCTIQAKPLVVDPGLRLLGALDNGNLRPVQVDRTPAQGGDLAPPQTAENCEHGGDQHPGFPHGVQQLDRLR